jgi:hypothetical protein
MGISLRAEAEREPESVPKLFALATRLQEQVHPAARWQWDGLMSHLEGELSDSLQTTPPRPITWHETKQWTKKLDKAFSELEKAHHQVKEALVQPPSLVNELGLIHDVWMALFAYLDLAQKLQAVREKQAQQG